MSNRKTKLENKYVTYLTLNIVLWSFVLSAIGMNYYFSLPYSPNFKVGECIGYTRKAEESWQQDYVVVEKIVKVGNKAYRTIRINPYTKLPMTDEIRFFLQYNYTKVDCPEELKNWEDNSNEK